MRSISKNRPEAGFTLIEVLVALAIAGGALVLIASANNASLRKSAQSRVSERLQRAAESKFAEWKMGAERANEGVLAGFKGHLWEVRPAREDLPGFRGLVRLQFRVRDSVGPVLEWTELRETQEDRP